MYQVPSALERRIGQASLLVCVLGFAYLLCGMLSPSNRMGSLQRLVAAFHARNSNGLAMARHHLEKIPGDPPALAMAAEIASRQSDVKTATSFLEQLPKDSSFWEFFANVGFAKQNTVSVRIAEIEKHLRRALEISPNDLPTCERLGHLLQAEGRVWESAPYFMRQILRGKCRGDELFGVACVERFYRLDERLSHMGLRDDYPDSPMLVAEARGHLFANRNVEAERSLRKVLVAHPGLGEAQGRLGRLIVDRGNLTDFLRWRGSLPDEARNHPEVWLAQGLQAKQLQMFEGAAYCFVKALKLSPGHISASLQLAQCLERLGYPAEAKMMGERGKLLGELDSTLNMMRNGPLPEPISKTIDLLERLNRYWEAAGWSLVLSYALESSRTVDITAARQEMNRYIELARKYPNADDLVGRLNLKEFAAPRWPMDSAVAADVILPVDASRFDGWDFQDDAATVGIDFRYYEGTTEETRMQHIFNTMGGGVGVLDLDQDGWPDLHFAQANDWRNSDLQPEYHDCTYINRDGKRFDDVTNHTRTGDLGFTHGVSVGDFDADGFPDIYLGNLGPNRLFHNNGDGTFTDVTPIAGVAGNEWTTSSAWCDLTGDGLPDLYVMNYSKMQETRDKECHEGTKQVACTPDLLTPEVGRLYVNAGDGSFRDVTNSLDPPLPAGRGLGVIGWRFTKRDRVDLFLANDTMANVLLANQGLDADGNLRLRDEAVIRGVALDPDGNALASMGVAAGDANGDGLMDLFITTFFGESKTLYSLRDDGFFEDTTRQMNLRESGFWMLGFGSQFADLNNDGWQDLIVTNGHVDQRTRRGDPDRMRPQVLMNVGGKRFEEVPAEKLGSFFRGQYLGRGLAVLDWNGDGRMDIAVSHLHAPVALVTNHTTSVYSKMLSLRLIGRNQRRPVGSSVSVKVGTIRQSRFVYAGDGFLVTNQDRLRFAIPDLSHEVEVAIDWPDGESSLRHLMIDTNSLTIVEGDERSWEASYGPTK